MGVIEDNNGIRVKSPGAACAAEFESQEDANNFKTALADWPDADPTKHRVSGPTETQDGKYRVVVSPA